MVFAPLCSIWTYAAVAEAATVRLVTDDDLVLAVAPGVAAPLADAEQAGP